MTTLAKGLAVLELFSAERPAMTLSQVAQALRLSRATARRILRTLAELGYVAQNGRSFSLSSGILKLGFAYLATQNWIEQATAADAAARRWSFTSSCLRRSSTAPKSFMLGVFRRNASCR